MKTCLFSILSLLLLPLLSFGQASPAVEEVPWSATRRLTSQDFQVRSQGDNPTAVSGRYALAYQVTGVDFLTRNFNKKVQNLFIKSSSWIDTTQSVQQSLRYQQTTFDMHEVYARLFRKELRENRKKLTLNLSFAGEAHERILQALAERQKQYERETKYAYLERKQLEWESRLQNELTDLAEYAYDR